MSAKRLFGAMVAVGLLSAPRVVRASEQEYPGRVHEHRLTPADSFTPDPKMTDGDIEPGESDFAANHLAEGARFTDPFLGAELYPELSAGTLVTLTEDRDTKAVGYGQRLDLNLYWLQLRFPLASAVDSAAAPLGHLDADLLLPLRLDANNRAGLLLGTSIPTRITGAAFQGYRAQLLYGFGMSLFDATARLGYGVVPSNAPAGGEPSAGILYGLTVGLTLTDWVRVAVEADGGHQVASRVDDLRLAPGLRFFPLREQTLELGLAALLELRDGGPDDNFGLRNVGGLFTAGYNFL